MSSSSRVGSKASRRHGPDQSGWTGGSKWSKDVGGQYSGADGGRLTHFWGYKLRECATIYT